MGVDMIWRQFVCFAAAATFVGGVAWAGAATGTHQPLKVSIFSGAAEYRSDETLARYKEYLEQHYDVQCTLNIVKDIHSLPGVEQLQTCDVIVVFVRRVEVPPEQVEQIKKYMAAGKPVVGLRTASHAFQTWLDFDHEVLGGDYHNHDKKNELAHVTIGHTAKDHPVLKGVEAFDTMGKLYRNPQVATDVTVLLTAASADDHQPVAWVRTRSEAHDQHVFYTSLGVPEDFENENFRRLVANAIFWTARVEPRIRPAIEKTDRR
jgi:type 1 glutamine amidotransferase